MNFQVLDGIILESEKFGFDVGVKGEHVDEGIMENGLEMQADVGQRVLKVVVTNGLRKFLCLGTFQHFADLDRNFNCCQNEPRGI